MSFLIISIASNTALFVPEPNEQTWRYNFELGFGITQPYNRDERTHAFQDVFVLLNHCFLHPNLLSSFSENGKLSQTLIHTLVSWAELNLAPQLQQSWWGSKTILISLDLDFVHSASSWLEFCFNPGGLSHSRSHLSQSSTTAGKLRSTTAPVTWFESWDINSSPDGEQICHINLHFKLNSFHYLCGQTIHLSRFP